MIFCKNHHDANHELDAIFKATYEIMRCMRCHLIEGYGRSTGLIIEQK